MLCSANLPAHWEKKKFEEMSEKKLKACSETEKKTVM